ncbi:hypothetical protein J1N35_013578 [Gossypium stocksii]|uniref:Uncharacterized protein n=1 Tax=Gossypium stocksii TaxID=47602 RepID=A0A9D3VSY7_9ROSI|nr:hypothetical protein J1N35_013578 [Gossypium stocksii]
MMSTVCLPDKPTVVAIFTVVLRDKILLCALAYLVMGDGNKEPSLLSLQIFLRRVAANITSLWTAEKGPATNQGTEQEKL